MPAPYSYDFAVIRVVPRVERQEFINAGVILFCLEKKFLAAHIWLDETRLSVLYPAIDLELVREYLAAIPLICAGAPDAGPVASLSIRERFHWLVAPRSTVIQVSPVHSGICEHPEAALSDLFGKMVFQPNKSTPSN